MTLNAVTHLLGLVFPFGKIRIDVRAMPEIVCDDCVNIG